MAKQKTTPKFRGVALRPDGTRIVTKLYTHWNNLKIRCKTKSKCFYRWYGAKGITYCAEWKVFANFRAWALASGFRKGLSIDRINGDGNYEPSNCRWTTRDEQMLNQRSTHRLTLNSVTKPLPVWARELGMSIDLLRSRKYQGWTDEQILTTPKLTGGIFREGVQHKPRGRPTRVPG